MIISIVMPVFNQLKFTKLCLESLVSTMPAGCEIIVIDNGSTDGTAEYLSGCPNVRIISNSKNIGCAAAWNQGVKVSVAPWTVLLNNDVLLSTNWLEGLLDFAKDKGAAIVSPAFREGQYNYNIVEYARAYVQRMSKVARMGVAHGICFMVQQQVFDRIGLFDETFQIGQFEDTDFFRRAKAAGFVLGITGRSFIHHFGSVTQNSLEKNNSGYSYKDKNRAYYRTKHNLTLWRRIRERRHAKLRDFWWRITERLLYKHSLIEKWIGGRLHYY